jgi:hypothetical protein
MNGSVTCAFATRISRGDTLCVQNPGTTVAAWGKHHYRSHPPGRQVSLIVRSFQPRRADFSKRTDSGPEGIEVFKTPVIGRFAPDNFFLADQFGQIQCLLGDGHFGFGREKNLYAWAQQ